MEQKEIDRFLYAEQLTLFDVCSYKDEFIYWHEWEQLRIENEKKCNMLLHSKTKGTLTSPARGADAT